MEDHVATLKDELIAFRKMSWPRGKSNVHNIVSFLDEF
jgi:hypothetical protein